MYYLRAPRSCRAEWYQSLDQAAQITKAPDHRYHYKANYWTLTIVTSKIRTELGGITVGLPAVP